MNVVTYVSERDGKTARIRVGQGGLNWLDQNGNRTAKGALPRKAPRRLPTVAEADRQMRAAGYIRRSVRGRRRARAK